MATLFGMFPFLKKLFADSGYQGPKFAKALAKVLPHLDVEIVKRSDRVSGFVVLPKRWIVERTIAWLNRCRRLAKDWENLNRKALAFLRLASIRLMLRKLDGLECPFQPGLLDVWSIAARQQPIDLIERLRTARKASPGDRRSSTQYDEGSQGTLSSDQGSVANAPTRGAGIQARPST